MRLFEIQQLEIGMRIHRPIMCQHFIKQPVLTVKVTGKKSDIKSLYKEASF